MKVVLYTTNCPKCKVLETKLNQKGIDYEVVTDVDVMTKKGFMESPILDVNKKIMNYGEAVKWVNNFVGE